MNRIEKQNMLIQEYIAMQETFDDINLAWQEHEITTIEAIERQRMLRERMQEVRERLAEVDEEEE